MPSLAMRSMFGVRIMLLTHLSEGQHATVLQLPAEPKTAAAFAPNNALLTLADHPYQNNTARCPKVRRVPIPRDRPIRRPQKNPLLAVFRFMLPSRPLQPCCDAARTVLRIAFPQPLSHYRDRFCSNA